MADDFTIDVAEVAGHGVDFVVTGEIDMLTAPQLRAALDDAAALGDRVVVDLGRCRVHGLDPLVCSRRRRRD